MDTYTITYNNGTTSTFTIKNGEKGDKGDNTYTWIKYASQKPTESSHSMGDIPDNWIGIYYGNAASAPTDWRQYQWFEIKGEQGDKGDPATLVSGEVTYQVSDSGIIIPSEEWSVTVPVVSQGKYLWTRIVQRFNTGDPITAYGVSRMGIDGSGTVSTVCEKAPDVDGNVVLTADDVVALPATGGDMTGEIRMNGHPISGLNTPTKNTQAANKGYVDTANAGAIDHANAEVRKAAPRNLLDNSDFTNLVAQAGIGGNHGTIAYAADRWILDSGTVSYEAGVGLTLNGTIRQKIEHQPAGQTIAFVGMASGAASISYADGAVTIASSGGVLKWAALYEGEYTAETLPAYRPKDYAAELAECQRYYYRLSNDDVYGVQNPGSLFNATTVRTTFTLPVEMRVNPTVSILSGAVSEWKVFSVDKVVHPTAYTVLYQLKNRAVNFALTIPSKTTQTPAVVCITSSIDFSADL